VLISVPHRQIIMNLEHPGSVTGIIPGAREIVLRGTKLVAVPHGVDEVRVLRNIGHRGVPAPINFYYDWPSSGKTPMSHQKETAAFLTLHERAYCLNEMGTCKTLSALWGAHYLKTIGMIDAIVVVAPLSTLERAWGDEIFSNFFDMTFTVLHGDMERRVKRIKKTADIYIINHDGVKTEAMTLCMTKHIVERFGKDRVLFIVDELAAYRNASSDRWQALNAIIQPCRWVWGMTGSPTPTDPTDAWAQCKLVTPWTVPKYYGRFRERVMRKITNFKWVEKEDWLQTVRSVMQPAIRFARKECIDLPPTTYRMAHVELTPEQKRAYKSMLDKCKSEFDGREVLALNEGVKVQKLVQIACGVVYDGENDDIQIPTGPRVSLAMELIEQSSNKVILFVPLRGALDMIAAEVAKKYPVAIIHGGVSKVQRDAIFSAFMQSPDPWVLIAQPAAMAHGLTLTAANTIIWYAPPNSNEIYGQANARIVRPGQTENTFIIHIEGTSVEREAYRRLERQERLQGALLDAIQRERQNVDA
jgi:SNF2 family DNA or RNA helicase